MNIQELRIGNWVKAGILVFKVSLQDFYDEVPMKLLSKCSPIELTPEILEKCGWDGNHSCLWVGDDAMILKNGDAYGLGFEWGIDPELTQIKHVHQLQNLYFALKGIELKIEL